MDDDFNATIFKSSSIMYMHELFEVVLSLAQMYPEDTFLVLFFDEVQPQVAQVYFSQKKQNSHSHSFFSEILEKLSSFSATV